MTEKVDESGDVLILTLIQRRLDGEWQRHRDLDTKANNMIGFISVAVSLLLGTGTISFINIGILDPYKASFFFVGTGLLIGSIILGLLAYKIRKLPEVPDVQHFIDKYKGEPHLTIVRAITLAMAEAVKQMKGKLDSKANFIDVGWYLLIAGLILVFIFVIIVVTSGVQVQPA